MEETVTYVEMTDPARLVPAAPAPGLVLEPLDRAAPLVPDLLARVGAAYGWRSSARTPEQWERWFAEHPRRTFWLLRHDGEPAGIVSLDEQDAGDVEIGSFGLLPAFVGRGLGGPALTLGVRRAWNLHPHVRRVWLHTSSLDHPNALPNYHRRGFRTYDTITRDRP
ncbi:GNAT family N-acetyltransferase [Actinomadura parmotrematis]|uniref:GNAT family N-acetyltransferase n=1 Tax=Actinomadura parmotrematis TaxID=2864039 RepID=A0ABS7FZR3_9ACTN|nr:GNAT family N-acetyltransferase [Actinomadura parmotrematis]MBW8485942.1 GNAT family N-acetyltransferase [Actinomadura parmotrematis]